jgi:integrase
LSFALREIPSTYSRLGSNTNGLAASPTVLGNLRHSHASWLIAGGANVLQVMKRLGHRDIRTTPNTYGHVFPSDEETLAGMFSLESETDSVRRRVAAN